MTGCPGIGDRIRLECADNLTYGNILSVYTGTDEAITALTDDGIEELQDMLAAARRTTKDWHDFLRDFVADPDIIARVKE